MNKKNRMFISCFGLAFIAFLIVYFGGLTGFYEYEQYRKRVLTEEQILAFEEDIKAGKEIDLTEYTEPMNRQYDNKVTSTGVAINNGIEKAVKRSINVTFRQVSRYISE